VGSCIWWARVYGYNVVDLYDGSFTRGGFESAVELFDPRILVVEGHGERDRLGGHMDKIVVDPGNVDLLSGRLVWSVSCNTASVLGEQAVRRGCRCYIGFSDELVWAQYWRVNPLLDGIGRWFWAPIVESIRKLVSGGTCSSAYAVLVEGLRRSIGFWEKQESKIASLVVMLLEHDLECSRMLGDPSANVIPPVDWARITRRLTGIMPWMLVGVFSRLTR